MSKYQDGSFEYLLDTDPVEAQYVSDQISLYLYSLSYTCTDLVDFLMECCVAYFVGTRFSEHISSGYY